MCIGFYPFTLCFKYSLNILFLYPIQVLEKMVFHFKIQVLENTDFGLKPNFYITKIVQNVYNMC